MQGRWLTCQTDVAVDSLPVHMPKAHCHSSKHPCAAHSFAFGSVASEDLFSPFGLRVPKGFHCNEELQLNLPCL